MIDEQASDKYPLNLDRLPRGWQMAWLKDCCGEIAPGFASGAHNKAGSGIPHLRPMNISRRGDLDLADIKFVDPNADIRRVRIGDVLFNNTNSPVLVGKTCPIRIDRDMAFSNHMTRLRPSQGLSAEFLARQLHFLWSSGYFLHRCVKHVNQASISTSPLSDAVPIVVAPSSEQVRIAEALESYFTRLDDAEASLERVRRNLERYRASVLQAAVEGRLVPTEAELARAGGELLEPAAILLSRLLEARRKQWNGRGKYREPASPMMEGKAEIPEGWCLATVEQLSTKVVDGVHKKPTYVAEGVPFVTVRNLTAGKGISFARLNYVTQMDHEQFIKRAHPEEGDLLLSKDGTLGVIRAIREHREFSIFVSVALIKPVAREMTDYLEIALSSETVQRQMVPKGSGLQHIHLEDLRKDCVPIPPLREQQRIVLEVHRHLSLIDRLEADLASMRAKAGLVHKATLASAFSGRLVDQDSADEPASALLDRISAERAKVTSSPDAPRRRGRPREAVEK